MMLVRTNSTPLRTSIQIPLKSKSSFSLFSFSLFSSSLPFLSAHSLSSLPPFSLFPLFESLPLPPSPLVSVLVSVLLVVVVSPLIRLSVCRDVAVPIRTLLPFKTLVDQCWGVLKRTVRPTFPTTTPAHPSKYVLMQPGGVTVWPGDFWEEIVAPALGDLLLNPPTYVDGWWNLMSRSLVDARLKANIEASSHWKPLMDFG